jgi:hypothetical protein
MGGICCRCGYRICAGNEGAASPGCTKTLRSVECLLAAPQLKVKKPVVLKQDLLGSSWTAWVGGGWLVRGLAVCHGVADCQVWRRILASLQAVDRDDLVPRPDSDGEGAGPRHRMS